MQDGGVRGRVHRQLIERAELIESELQTGERGRDRLMQDPELPPGLREQLANIPVRAFDDPQLMTGVAALFRDALFSKEDAIAAARDSALAAERPRGDDGLRESARRAD